MFAVCLRYSKCQEDAEDIFQQGFIKVFQKIHQLIEPKALPGWLKSLFVREALDFYKASHQKQVFESLSDINSDLTVYNEAVDALSIQEIRAAINLLPHKCRMVFNLFVIDGFSHAEISEMMQISEGTSKSQLFEAKKRLKQTLLAYQTPNIPIS